jgi:hypothetical protein
VRNKLAFCSQVLFHTHTLPKALSMAVYLLSPIVTSHCNEEHDYDLWIVNDANLVRLAGNGNPSSKYAPSPERSVFTGWRLTVP